MSQKQPRNFPRKIIKKRPSWCAQINVFVKGEEGYSYKFFFGAFYGGEAKAKALPKIQRFLDVAFWGSKSSPKICVVLKKVSKNGNNGTPTYVLRERYSYLNSLLVAKYPSRVFKVK